MKVVRLEDNIVREIIPEYALPVEKWYGEAFASLCIEAPDEVDEYYVYDPETGTFSEPVETTTEPEPTLDERITALEDSNAEMTEALDLLLSGVTE